jgi:hypothetical protein
MVVVPDAAAVTIPVDEPMAATAALLLFHTPPPGESDRVAVAPGHNSVTPEMAAGAGVTVTGRVAAHPGPV